MNLLFNVLFTNASVLEMVLMFLLVAYFLGYLILRNKFDNDHEYRMRELELERESDRMYDIDEYNSRNELREKIENQGRIIENLKNSLKCQRNNAVNNFGELYDRVEKLELQRDGIRNPKMDIDNEDEEQPKDYYNCKNCNEECEQCYRDLDDEEDTFEDYDLEDETYDYPDEDYTGDYPIEDEEDMDNTVNRETPCCFGNENANEENVGINQNQ